jgi:hypothetical protein
LFVADLLHPADVLAVELLLNRDMTHRGGRGRAVQMLLAGRKRAGSGGLKSGSNLTVPVNQSAEPFAEGCAPLRFMSITEFRSENDWDAWRPCSFKITDAIAADNGV